MGDRTAPTSAQPQRRLSAVLHADAAGYSRVMRADEEGALALLRAHIEESFAPAATRRGGRIVKLSGDGVMCEFSSAYEALLAAIDIQESSAKRNQEQPAGRRLTFRMGLHLGDVLAQEDDIFGDTVNVAARLQSLAAPGGILLSSAAYEQVRDRACPPLADLGERRLKNIDRPMRVYAVGPRPRPAWPRRWAVIAAAALFAIAIAGAGWRVLAPRAPTSDSAAREITASRPVLAVLPFANLSDDPGQDYFATGLTEDIAAALSRFRGLSVIASNAATAQRGQPAPGAELKPGASHLVEGSVRRSGARLRVSAQLTEAGQGRVLWAEQFDEDSSDVFEVQDRVARSVAGALVATLDKAEVDRALAKRPGSLDAYDLVLRARAALARRTRAENRLARQYLEQAIALEPDYAAAHVWRGVALYLQAQFGWTEFAAQALQEAKEAQLRASQLDDRDALPHAWLARIYADLDEFELALAEADKALALNPSDGESLSQRGRVLLWAGRVDEAIASIEAARVLSPAFDAAQEFYLGLAYYSARRYREAAAQGEQLLARAPDFPVGPAVLAAAYGQLERLEEARAALQLQRSVNPSFALEALGSRFRDAADREHLLDGLRKAGLR